MGWVFGLTGRKDLKFALCPTGSNEEGSNYHPPQREKKPMDVVETIESLRARIQAMELLVRQNEAKQKKFDVLERKLIGASSLWELLSTLAHDYRNDFSIDWVTVALVDPEYEVIKLLDLASEDRHGLESHFVTLDSDMTLSKTLGNELLPYLGRMKSSAVELFGDYGKSVASIAVLPLVHQGQVLGSINLASADIERFSAGPATDFLERLSAIAALCLQSALSAERLKAAGLTDALTGVKNRRYFEARSKEEVAYALRSNAPLACLFFDIDKFKSMNDTYGHQVGDEILRYVAKVIQVQLRASEVLARYGGEEFVVLLPGVSELKAVATAERIRKIVAAQSIPVNAKQTVRLTISCGVSVLNQTGEAPSSAVLHVELLAAMIARADQGVYLAKGAGRNSVIFVE
jgi:diguanylate cyclase (GGDEF)-like protein